MGTVTRAFSVSTGMATTGEALLRKETVRGSSTVLTGGCRRALPAAAVDGFDRENRRSCHFDLDGKYVGTVTQHLRRPCQVSFSGDYAVVSELEGALRS